MQRVGVEISGRKDRSIRTAQAAVVELAPIDNEIITQDRRGGCIDHRLQVGERPSAHAGDYCEGGDVCVIAGTGLRDKLYRRQCRLGAQAGDHGEILLLRINELCEVPSARRDLAERLSGEACHISTTRPENLCPIHVTMLGQASAESLARHQRAHRRLDAGRVEAVDAQKLRIRLDLGAEDIANADAVRRPIPSSAMTSATAPPRPPMIECSSTVTMRPVVARGALDGGAIERLERVHVDHAAPRCRCAFNASCAVSAVLHAATGGDDRRRPCRRAW